MKEIFSSRSIKLCAQAGSAGKMDIYIRCGNTFPNYLLTRCYDPYLMDLLRNEISLYSFYEKSQKVIASVAKSGHKRWQHKRLIDGKKRRIRAQRLEGAVNHLFSVVYFFLQTETDYAEAA